MYVYINIYIYIYIYICMNVYKKKKKKLFGQVYMFFVGYIDEIMKPFSML
jgi:hypothetical protein